MLNVHYCSKNSQHQNANNSQNLTSCIDVYLPSGLTMQQQQLQTKKKLEFWYKQQATNYFIPETFKIAKSMQLHPKKVNIRKYSQRWGSCNNRQEITFNWLLIMAPESVVNYVIVHELCHILHMNHSKNFWNAVQSFLPSYKTQKNWLRQNEHLLYFPVNTT